MAGQRGIGCIISGVVFAMDLIVWHKSILDVGAGVATLLANTQVFWVAIVSAGLLGEKLPRKFWLCGLVALLGVAALTLPAWHQPSSHQPGSGSGYSLRSFSRFHSDTKGEPKPNDALPSAQSLPLFHRKHINPRTGGHHRE